MKYRILKSVYYTAAPVLSVLLFFFSLYFMGVSNQTTVGDKNELIAQTPIIEFTDVYIYDLPEVVKTAISREFDFKNIVNAGMGRGPSGEVLIRVIVREKQEQIARFYSPRGERLDQI